MSLDNPLFSPDGKRLYLTADERTAFIDASQKAKRGVRTFCTILAFTGCRVSEALALTPERLDFSGKAVIFETLKKRKSGIYRAVPVPPDLLDSLDMVHGVREIQSGQKKAALTKPLWRWSRSKAWYLVKTIMEDAKIQDGAHKMPKGLRHAYGIHALNSGVPLNLLSKWMGHGSLEVTAIYANAVGEEQHNIAARMWG
jgi:integrase